MDNTKSRSLSDYFVITLKGIAMGAADVVPGVSGGTIAFISGIYQELIGSISRINIESLRILKNQGIGSFWKYINGNFFVALLSGILISILSLSKLVVYLLDTQPILVWSFFFGLMLCSIFFVSKSIERWSLRAILSFILTGVFAYYITVIPPLASNNGLIFIFFSGALAICAMILPGISGAFILVLLGAYHIVLNAVSTFDFSILLPFAFGIVCGILSFSRALNWLFSNHKNTTIAGLTGFIVGSLNKVWPWKQTLDYEIDENGNKIILLEKSIFPQTYLENVGDPQIGVAICSVIVGFFLIYFLEKIASKIQK